MGEETVWPVHLNCLVPGEELGLQLLPVMPRYETCTLTHPQKKRNRMNINPYLAGWGFSWLFVVMCGVTILLLIMKNRFAVVLMAAILADNLHLLESTNLWDYLVDPFMVLGSCIALSRGLLRKLSKRP